MKPRMNNKKAGGKVNLPVAGSKKSTKKSKRKGY